MWGYLCGSWCGPLSKPLNDAFIEHEPLNEPLPKREALRKHEVFNDALRGSACGSLPSELQDYILLFLEGHERADFGIKTVANRVKIPPAIQNIVHMIELYEFRTMFRVDGTYTLFIEKVNAENLKGFISKMIRNNREIDGTVKGTLEIEYYWIKFCDY